MKTEPPKNPFSKSEISRRLLPSVITRAACALLVIFVLTGCASGSADNRTDFSDQSGGRTGSAPAGDKSSASIIPDDASYLIRMYKNENASEESFFKDAEIIKERIDVLTEGDYSFRIISSDENTDVPVSFIDAQIPAEVIGGRDPDILSLTLLSGREKFYLFDASAGLPPSPPASAPSSTSADLTGTAPPAQGPDSDGDPTANADSAGTAPPAPEPGTDGAPAAPKAPSSCILLNPEDIESAGISHDVPPGLSSSQLTLRGLSEESCSAVKFVLSEKFMEAHPEIRNWTPAIALDAAGDYGGLYVLNADCGENDRTYYCQYTCAGSRAGNDREVLDRYHKVLARNMMSAPSASAFSTVWIPPVSWEEPAGTSGNAGAQPAAQTLGNASAGTQGAFLLSRSELESVSKDTGTLTFFYTWEDENADSDDMDSAGQVLKSRLDAVGMPYALGRQSDCPNVFAVCTIPGRVSPYVISMICGNSVITLVGGETEKLITPDSCKAEVIEQNGHYVLSLDFSEHNLNIPDQLIAAAKAAGSDMIALRVSYSQEDFLGAQISAADKSGRLVFDRLPAKAVPEGSGTPQVPEGTDASQTPEGSGTPQAAEGSGGTGSSSKWKLDLIAAALNGRPIQHGMGKTEEGGSGGRDSGSIGYERKTYGNYLTWDKTVLRQKGQFESSRSVFYSADPDAAGF